MMNGGGIFQPAFTGPMTHFPFAGPPSPFAPQRSASSERDSAPRSIESLNELQERRSDPESRGDRAPRKEDDVGTVLLFAVIGCLMGFSCLAGKFLVKYGRRLSLQKMANDTAEHWSLPPVANVYMPARFSEGTSSTPSLHDALYIPGRSLSVLR
jgi:hypothetical protein